MVRFMLALGGIILIFTGVYALSLLIAQLQTPPLKTPPEYQLEPLPEKSQVDPSSIIQAAISTITTTKAINGDSIMKVVVIANDKILEKNVPYIEITTGCALHLGASCVRAYSRPSTTSRERAQLRIGSVLHVGQSTTTKDGTLWYEIVFDEPIRYPDRFSLPWYIPASAGVIHYERGIEELSTTTATSTKSLVISRSKQTMIAYEGETVVRTYTISTGLELTPTPRGAFTVFRKTPTRYMQGPLPGISSQYYDLPGVPWNLYFTKQGAVVHGAYWHDSFGQAYSHGCVNVDPTEARELYAWAELKMTVVVKD